MEDFSSTTEPLKFLVRSRDEIRDPETGQVDHFSSAPSYDTALASIFPYFIEATHEESRELVGVLEQGYRRMGYIPTSYAVVVNMGAEKNRIIWLSASSIMTLEQHGDLYELEFASYSSSRPSHRVKYD